MSSNARIFFAGVGTTFVILAVGFGAGLMMASSTLPDTARRAGSSSERLAPVRVILPASAEPAQPPQQLQPEQPMTAAIPAPEIAAASSTGKGSPGSPRKAGGKAGYPQSRSRTAGTPSSIC